MLGKRIAMVIVLPVTTFLVCGNHAASQGDASVSSTQVRPGQRVVISNRFGFGSIIVIGWDGETVEATAKTLADERAVPVTIKNDPADAARIVITTAPAPAQPVNEKVRLTVKVPHHAELEPIYVPKAEVNVTNLKRKVDVRSDSGKVIVSGVAAATVRTASGEIRVSDVTGDVRLDTSSANVVVTRVNGDLTADAGSANLRITETRGSTTITTTTGNVDLKYAMGDVRVVSINGRTNIHCAKGRVDIGDTSGVITLSGVDGDVDVMTSGGRATLTGLPGADHLYRLRTLSGSVSVNLPADTKDFIAKLSSYSGKIQNDFPASEDSATQPTKKGQRQITRIGNDRGRIELDSFDGPVRLSKIKTDAIEKCER
jgi:hypothetical protein